MLFRPVKESQNVSCLSPVRSYSRLGSRRSRIAEPETCRGPTTAGGYPRCARDRRSCPFPDSSVHMPVTEQGKGCEQFRIADSGVNRGARRASAPLPAAPQGGGGQAAAGASPTVFQRDCLSGGLRGQFLLQEDIQETHRAVAPGLPLQAPARVNVWGRWERAGRVKLSGK